MMTTKDKNYPYNIFSMGTTNNIAVMYGGGQIPEANVLMGYIISRFCNYMRVFGIHQSYKGLGRSECYEEMTEEKASEIKKQIGTYFSTCRDFNPAADENFPDILQQLKAHCIGLLIICGGDGSARGAVELEAKLKEAGYNILIIWLPCTIDGITGTESIGFKSAVLKSTSDVMNMAVNSWATYDHGLKGPRIAIVEMMGRNRDDILVKVMRIIQNYEKIGKYNVSDVRIVPIPSSHVWSYNQLILDVLNEDKPVTILTSEGATPVETSFGAINSKGVARKLEMLFNLTGVKKSNCHVVGYLSQTNSENSMEEKECSTWAYALESMLQENGGFTEAQAFIYRDCCGDFAFVPLKEITEQNPYTKEAIPLSDEDKRFLEEFLIKM